MLTNPRLGLALTLAFDTAELPHLFQWKMLGSRAYVLGLEAGQLAGHRGRATARRPAPFPCSSRVSPGTTG